MAEKKFKLIGDKGTTPYEVFYGVKTLLENNFSRYKLVSENNGEKGDGKISLSYIDYETKATINIETNFPWLAGERPLYLQINCEKRKMDETINGVRLNIPKKLKLEKIVEEAVN